MEIVKSKCCAENHEHSLCLGIQPLHYSDTPKLPFSSHSQKSLTLSSGFTLKKFSWKFLEGRMELTGQQKT